MERKKLYAIIGSFTSFVLAATAFGGMSLTNANIENNVYATDSYTFTLSAGDFGNIQAEDETWVYGTVEIPNQAGYDITYDYKGLTSSNDDGYLCTLLGDTAFFSNRDKLTSIQNVTINIDSEASTGSLYLYRGWYSNAYETEPAQDGEGDGTIEFQTSSDVLISDGTLIDLSGIQPNYLMFIASGGAVYIESITYTYACTSAATTVTSSFRIETYMAPQAGGESLYNSTYLWAWVAIGDYNGNYLFTKKADGTWYLDLDETTYSVLTDGALQFTFVLGSETAPNWSYQSTSHNGYSLRLSQGQTTYMVGSTIEFSNQPDLVLSTYDVTINYSISFRGTNNWYNTLTLKYNSKSFNYKNDWPNEYKIVNTSSGSATQEGTFVLTSQPEGTFYFSIYVCFTWLEAPRESGESYGCVDSSGTLGSVELTSDTTINLNCDFTCEKAGEIAIIEFTSVSEGEITTEGVSVANLTTTVYGGENQEGVTPEVTFQGNEEEYELSVVDSSLDNVNIRIENNRIIGLKGGTTNEVKLTTNITNIETIFTVTVQNRSYSSNYTSLWTSDDFEETEDWFDTKNSINSSNIQPINNLSSDFANGVDISSVKALYENGARYYDYDGNEQSLFYLLKDAGVNWVRIRLWNRPSETYVNGSDTITYDYGGGSCDLDRVTWMCHEAHLAGLKILLDFHYSDFWTHPGQQVMPKDWSNLTSVNDVSGAVRNYTKETLIHLYNNGALPSVVQLGNEISSGMLMLKASSYDTSSTAVAQGKNPKYISNTISAGTVAGNKGTNSNLVTYLSAASAGVDDAITSIGANNINKEIGTSDIKKMVHWTSTLSTTTYPNRFNNLSTAINFYNNLNNVDYDVIGLSAYPFYDFQTDFSALSDGLNALETRFSNKEIMIAETSSPFTSNGWNDFTANSVTTTCSEYEVSVVGQAKIIRDITNAVASIENGTGVFYWEPAWLPIGEEGTTSAYVGWADEGSKVSWANQGLFSFGGKALGSLKVYDLMNPNV